MRQALLLLADSRLPAGGHAHSGGIAPAVEAGLVGGQAKNDNDLADVVGFLRGRLHTAGLLAGAVAARAAYLASGWVELDEAVDARTPAPAQRAASRAQGRALLRVARRAFPHPLLGELGAHPHHPVVLGVAVQLAGGSPQEAAEIAIAGALNGPASAALRLLGLDPLALTAAQAALATEADAVATEAAYYADQPTDTLPAPSAPLLDLLAQAHARSEVRLFAS
jgi:urease accessory protein